MAASWSHVLFFIRCEALFLVVSQLYILGTKVLDISIKTLYSSEPSHNS